MMLLWMQMVYITICTLTYNKRLIKCNENNMQAWKLNEPVGFLVSALNNYGSRQQVKSKEIQREKKIKNKKQRKNNLFT